MNSLDAPLLDDDHQKDVKLITIVGSPHESGELSFGDEGDGLSPNERQGSVPGGVFNLSSTILGASCLAMPSAAKGTGIIVYLILLVIMGAMSEFSLRMLTASTRLSNCWSYYSVGRAAAGRPGEMAAIAAVLIQQTGAVIAYIKIIGTVLHPIVSGINNSVLSDVRFWQCALTIVVIFPLLMLRRMEMLKYSSLTAVGLIMLFVSVLFIDGASQLHGRHYIGPEKPGVTLVHLGGVLDNIPVMAFAFVCHMNVFPIVSELKNPTPRRTNIVSAGSVVVCFIVYAIAGTFGYLGFLDQTQDDVLNSYQDIKTYLGVKELVVPHTFVSVVQVGIGLALVFTYPVLAFELRHSIDTLVFGHKPFSWMRHTLENVGIAVVSVVVAISVKSVKTVFGYTGAICSTSIVFILPALFYYKLDQTPLAQSWMRKFALLQCIVGVLLVPVCLAALVKDQIKK